MLALTLEKITYGLKEPSLVLPKNPTDEQLEDYNKLMTSFNDNNLIVKIIMIAYMNVNLTKVFEDYQTVREVFGIVSVNYDTKNVTHIQISVQ